MEKITQIPKNFKIKFNFSIFTRTDLKNKHIAFNVKIEELDNWHDDLITSTVFAPNLGGDHMMIGIARGKNGYTVLDEGLDDITEEVLQGYWKAIDYGI